MLGGSGPFSLSRNSLTSTWRVDEKRISLFANEASDAKNSMTQFTLPAAEIIVKSV